MSGRTYNHETNIIHMLNFYTCTHFYCTTEREGAGIERCGRAADAQHWSGKAGRRHPLAKGGSSGYALLEQPGRDTPCPR